MKFCDSTLTRVCKSMTLSDSRVLVTRLWLEQVMILILTRKILVDSDSTNMTRTQHCILVTAPVCCDPSGKCAKFHNVAASKNRDHMPLALCYGLFAQYISECCSSHTSPSWWIAHSMQRQQRSCNNARIVKFTCILFTCCFKCRWSSSKQRTAQICIEIFYFFQTFLICTITILTEHSLCRFFFRLNEFYF